MSDDRIMRFYSRLYPFQLKEEEAIELRDLLGKYPRKYFVGEPQEILKFKGMKQCYHGVATRIMNDHNLSTKEYVCRSSAVYLDVDFHEKKLEELNSYKLKMIELFNNDALLSEYGARIDSGYGLHFYYFLPTPVDIVAMETYLHNLFNYACMTQEIANYADKRVLDGTRVLRVPGTVNIRNGYVCDVSEINDRVASDELMTVLRFGRKTHSRPKYSTSQAMILAGYPELTDTSHNHPCPCICHGGSDRKPSFRYYSDTDTFWCFKCQGKAGHDGEDFLKAVGKTELLTKMTAEVFFEVAPNHTLLQDGQLLQRAEDGKSKLICNFYSSQIITSDDEIFGKAVFVKLPNGKSVRMDDLPNNRTIKSRYHEAGYPFVVNYKHSELYEQYVRFMDLATPVEGSVVRQQGINGNDYFFNGRLYPIERPDMILNFNTRPALRIDPYDINKFIKALIADNNYTHVIALLWGVAATCKDVIIRQGNLFPILVATGMKNSGKSKLGQMVMSMYGRTMAETMNTTDFTFIKNVSDCGSYPIHFDEYARKFREMEHEERIKEMAVQYPYREARGNSGQSINNFMLTACPIITGEKGIRDSGIISRSLVLNVTRNDHPTDEHFRKWYRDVMSFKLVSFMHDVLCNYHDLRRWYENNIDTFNRSEIIKMLPSITLKYLEHAGIIEMGLVDTKTMEKTINETESIKSAIFAGEYGEIFEDLSLLEYVDAGNIGGSYLSDQMDRVCYFTDGPVMVNMSELYKIFRENGGSSNRYKISLSNFKNAIMGSPSYRGDFLNHYIRGKQFRQLVALRVDDANFNFFTTIMKYKLKRANENPEDAITYLDHLMKNGKDDPDPGWEKECL